MLFWGGSPKGNTYLQRWRNTFRNDQTSLGSTLSIILYNKISRDPNTIGVLRSTDWVHWHSAIAGQWRMNYAMTKSYRAIGDGKRLEKSGAFPMMILDCHCEGLCKGMKTSKFRIWEDAWLNSDEAVSSWVRLGLGHSRHKPRPRQLCAKKVKTGPLR